MIQTTPLTKKKTHDTISALKLNNMKQNTHPTNHPAIFVDTSCGVEFKTTSTMNGEDTRDIDGVTHQVHNIEISSASHPFYTGKEMLIDTARRVEKFQARMQKQEDTAKGRKGKKAKRATRAATKEKEANTETKEDVK